MLYQEVALWDAKRTKEKSKYSNGPHQIQSMARLIDKQIQTEMTKKPAKSSSRVKRELDLAKQTGLVEDFRLEHAGLSMLLHDGESTKHRFHEIRTFQLGMSTHLTVPREMRCSSLLNKYQQRLTGYTQTLVTALHERREGTDSVGNARGRRLWALSSSIARIVSGRSSCEPVQWPQSADIVEILFTLELIEQQSAVLRVASHQDTGLPAAGSTGSLAGSVHSTAAVVSFSQGLERITESYHILTKILMLLRDWPDEDEMDVVIIQWFRAFKATLSSEYMPHVDVHDERREVDPAEGSVVTSAVVALEVAWWTRAMCNGKRNELNPHEPETPIEEFEDYDESAPLSQWQKKQLRARHNAENNINVKGKKGMVAEEVQLPSLREDGDGFYLAVVSTYSDVFFASRSVFMHLLRAISARKITLARRNQYKSDMEQVQSTATSKAEIEAERSLAAEAEAARQQDMAFIHQSRDAMLRLSHSALDLCQLVLTPLEDVFCSVRRLGIGDFRYIENGERCVTETLRLICAVMAACTSERPLGSKITAPEPIRQVPTQPTNKNRRGERKAPNEPETVSDDATVEEAQVLSTAESEELLHRCHHLFKSCSQICIEGIENIPMQSALMQSVNTIAIYLLQENARLLRFRNLASEELATLKPVTQVLTDMFGAGPAAEDGDPSVETEQQRWDRVTAATKRPHRLVVADLISAMTAVVPSLLSSMSMHKEIPSIQYYGFLNLRLLFRLPFFKPNQLEELLAEGGGMDGDSLDGGLDGGVTGHSESISAGDSVLDVDGGLSMLSISEWRGAHTAEAGALYSRETHRESCRERLANVVAFTGENHASKLEVLEQYLLFLLHVSGSSLECQGILQQIKIDVVLQRISILQHQSPYFTALCELLREQLRTVEDAL